MSRQPKHKNLTNKLFTEFVFDKLKLHVFVIEIIHYLHVSSKAVNVNNAKVPHPNVQRQSFYKGSYFCPSQLF